MNEDEKDSIATLVRLAGRRPEAVAERAARVKAVVAEEWRATIRRRRQVRAGVAAGVAAGLAGVLLMRSQPATPIPTVVPIVARVQTIHGPGRPLRAGARLNIPENAYASLEWNGATLRIDGGTQLTLDSPNAATLHRGAVYYTGNGARVTLHTSFGDVRDIGTRFEVRLIEDAVRVRVRDGAVELRGTTARAGTELVATRTDVTAHAASTSGAEWAWIEQAAPPILLEGRTLDSVLRQVAEEKGLRLAWKHSRDVLLHGDVPLSATEALDAATAAAGVGYRIEGDRLIVGGRS
jgi:ferric-dicitrate binding protein FerR (iron transport regulator)